MQCCCLQKQLNMLLSYYLNVQPAVHVLIQNIYRVLYTVHPVHFPSEVPSVYFENCELELLLNKG